MSRAKRILAQARREAWLCGVCVTVAVAAGIWSYAAWLYDHAGGCVLLAVLTMALLRLSVWHWSERRRLRGKVFTEEICWNPPVVIRHSSPTAPSALPVMVIGLAVAVGVPALLFLANLIFSKLL